MGLGVGRKKGLAYLIRTQVLGGLLLCPQVYSTYAQSWGGGWGESNPGQLGPRTSQFTLCSSSDKDPQGDPGPGSLSLKASRIPSCSYYWLALPQPPPSPEPAPSVSQPNFSSAPSHLFLFVIMHFNVH